MEPSLERGWRVRVEPLRGDPEPGALVLFQTASGYLLHRVLHLSRQRDGSFVFHRGDAQGGIGMIRANAALGRVTAVLSPSGEPVPTLESLPAERRRAFERARARSRAFARARAVALGLGLVGTPLARLGRRALRRLLR